MSNAASAAALLAARNRQINQENAAAQQAPKPRQQSSAAARSRVARRSSVPARPRVTQAPANVPTKTPMDNTAAISKAALLAHKSGTDRSANLRPSKSDPSQDAREEAQARALLAATKSFGTGQRENALISHPMTARQANTAQRKMQARRQESDNRHDSNGRYKTDIIHMRPEFVTEHPPIRLEREEKEHKEALRASAISLARQQYAAQKKREAEAPEAERCSSFERQRIVQQHTNLHDQAQKLASDKLAKLQEADKDKSFTDYYGYTQPQRSKSQRLLTKARGSRRTGSDSEDIAQSRRIRSQMTLLQAQIAEVDSKQQHDRDRVLAAARKRVDANMHKLDEEVFRDTGKMSPAMMSDWDAKARARLREQKVLQPVKANDAIDIGGGKRMDRSEVDALAEARVIPTLASIDDTVEKKRAAEEKARQDEEERKRQAQEEKQKKREEREEKKRVHDEEKAQRRREKEEKKKLERKERSHESDEDVFTTPPAIQETMSRGPEDTQGGSRRSAFFNRLSTHLPMGNRKSRDDDHSDVSSLESSVYEDEPHVEQRKKPIWKRLSRNQDKPAETTGESSSKRKSISNRLSRRKSVDSLQEDDHELASVSSPHGDAGADDMLVLDPRPSESRDANDSEVSPPGQRARLRAVMDRIRISTSSGDSVTRSPTKPAKTTTRSFEPPPRLDFTPSGHVESSNGGAVSDERNHLVGSDQRADKLAGLHLDSKFQEGRDI